jgi:CubicO group peptidase (beta-lactamase class C family)
MNKYNQKYSKYKYNKYKRKYLKLKGGMEQKTTIDVDNIEIIEVEPYVKKVQYEDGKLYISNNIDDEKLNQHSQFLIGSITKVFTVFVLLLLQQDKLLNVNDKVDKYVKSNKNNDFSTITILDLIKHKSGMKNFPDTKVDKYYKNAQEVTNSFINEELLTKTKGVYEYSNIGYTVLGLIMESVTNQTYLEIYKEYIFDKLDMKNTSALKQTNIKLYNSKGNLLDEKETMQQYFASTNGGLYSTVHDMILFCSGIMKLLDEKSMNIIKTLEIIKVRGENVRLAKDGGIAGGNSNLYTIYNKNNDLTYFHVTLETVFG